MTHEDHVHAPVFIRPFGSEDPWTEIGTIRSMNVSPKLREVPLSPESRRAARAQDTVARLERARDGRT